MYFRNSFDHVESFLLYFQPFISQLFMELFCEDGAKSWSAAYFVLAVGEEVEYGVEDFCCCCLTHFLGSDHTQDTEDVFDLQELIIDLSVFCDLILDC